MDQMYASEPSSRRLTQHCQLDAPPASQLLLEATCSPGKILGSRKNLQKTLAFPQLEHMQMHTIHRQSEVSM